MNVPVRIKTGNSRKGNGFMEGMRGPRAANGGEGENSSQNI